MILQQILSLVPETELLFALTAKASVFLGLALAACALLRRSAASMRHFVIGTAVMTLVILPALISYVPGWRVPVPASVHSHLPRVESVSTAHRAVVGGSALQTESGGYSQVQSGLEDVTRSAIPNLVICLWLLGTGIAATRVCSGLVNSARLRSGALPAGGSTGERVRRFTDAASAVIGLRSDVPVLVSGSVRVPQVQGLLRPAVVLPACVAEWPDERLVAVIRHELAHVKRRDHITWPLANLAASWQWFNPVVWLALARMRLEKEKACDDHVLGSGTDNIGYAEQLLGVCASLRSSFRFMPAGLLFARKNEMEVRIMYLFRQKIDRRPMSGGRRIAAGILLALLILPLVGIHGFEKAKALEPVSKVERESIIGTLGEFYGALSDGVDYESVRDRFLTSDYFADPSLTLENLDKPSRRVAFDNTLTLLRQSGVGVANNVLGQIISVEREGTEYVVTQNIDITANRIEGEFTVEELDDGAIRYHSANAGRKASNVDCHLVSSLQHEIRFRKEDGFWKISRFDDGVKLMRMDVNNIFGPIFLVWIEDIDSDTTPFGPCVFKIIPLDVVPEASNAKFVLRN